MPTSTRTWHVRFTTHCGKFTNAPRADRGVRPYGCIPFCIGASKFAMLYRAGGAEPLPYANLVDSTRSPMVHSFCKCLLRNPSVSFADSSLYTREPYGARFDGAEKTRSNSKIRTLPLISPLRGQLPPEGKPWARCGLRVQLLHTVCVLCTGIMWNTVKRVFHGGGCGKVRFCPHGLVEKKPLRRLAGSGFSTARTPYYVLLRIYSLPFFKRRGKEVLK